MSAQAGQNGMDVQEVTRLMAQLAAQVRALSSVIGTVDGVVKGLQDVWDGDDLAAFVGSWTNQHRPSAANAVQMLENLATTGLGSEIQQQIGASDGASPGSGPLNWLQLLEGGLGGVPAGDRERFLAEILAAGGLGTLLNVLTAGGPMGAFQWGSSVYGEVSTISQLLEETSDSGGFDTLDGPIDFLNVLSSGYSAWTATAGDDIEERVADVEGGMAANAAIDGFPVTEGANCLSCGALGDDADFGVDVFSGFLDGVRKGGLSEGLSEANQAWGQWADSIANGGGPIGLLARGENDLISAAYGPVSHAVSHMSADVGHVASGLKHLAESIF